MDTTQVMHTLSATALFWKWFLIGLVGFPLHWLFAIKGDMSPAGKLREFFTKYWADQLFALLSYWLLVYAWHEGTVFVIFDWVGWHVDPFRLNLSTVLIAFFAASIMSSIITFTQWALGKVGDRFQKMFGEKVDTVGEKKP